MVNGCQVGFWVQLGTCHKPRAFKHFLVPKNTFVCFKPNAKKDLKKKKEKEILMGSRSAFDN